MVQVEVISPVAKALDELAKNKYYTFKPKEERSFKVVLRYMHYSTNKTEIVTKLAEVGHKVKNINNILQRGIKKHLPLFTIELNAAPNNKSIYDMHT